MPDAVSFAEIDGQRVELLPARTVMSLFATGGGNGGTGGSGGSAYSGIGLGALNVNVTGDETHSAGDSVGGAGGAAKGGIGG